MCSSVSLSISCFQSWISKPKFLVEGVVYETDSSTPEYTQVKKVPEAAVVARIKGSWRGKITIKRTNDKVSTSTGCAGAERASMLS